MPAQPPAPPKPAHRAQAARPRPAHLKLHVAGIRDRSLGVAKKVRAVGYLHPFVRGQHVHIKLAA